MKQGTLIFLALTFLFSGCGSSKFLISKKQFADGEYYQALETVREVYPKLKDKQEKAEAVYMMGRSYQMLGEYSKAVPWFKNAIRYNYPQDDLQLSFAESQKAAGKLDEGAKVYGQILEQFPGDEQAKNGLKGIALAKGWMDDPTLYQVERASRLSSTAHERSVSFIDSGQQVLVNSSRQEADGKNFNPVDGQKAADLFRSNYNTKLGKWSFPILDEELGLNSEAHEGLIHISSDEKKLVCSRAVFIDGKKSLDQLFVSLKNNGTWGQLIPLSFSTDGFNYPQASWSNDGQCLFFSSNRSGGKGGYDIWKAKLNSGVEFEDPINLGKEINTLGDEIYPLERRKDILYFSSNYHVGAGAQDIFKARIDRGKWKVENMGFPVNSTADDFGIQFVGEREKGLFLSNRKGSRGLDVYTFMMPPKLFMCFGKVFNDETDSIISNVNIRIAGADGELQRFVTNDGKFQAELMPDNEYTIIAYKKGFLNAQAKISTRNMNEAMEFELDFRQTPTDKPIQLDRIYYESGKWNLLPSSKESLNQLVEILHQNPTIKIELSAHTDEVGENAFNLDLSQKRAAEVVRYLKDEKGILADRLKAKGYGEVRPLVVSAKLAKKMVFLMRNDKLSSEFISNLEVGQQEIAKSLNRRTEFEVISD